MSSGMPFLCCGPCQTPGELQGRLCPEKAQDRLWQQVFGQTGHHIPSGRPTCRLLPASWQTFGLLPWLTGMSWTSVGCRGGEGVFDQEHVDPSEHRAGAENQTMARIPGRLSPLGDPFLLQGQLRQS